MKSVFILLRRKSEANPVFEVDAVYSSAGAAMPDIGSTVVAFKLTEGRQFTSLGYLRREWLDRKGSVYLKLEERELISL